MDGKMGKSMMSDDEEIEKKYQGNTRYDERCYEGNHETLLRSILRNTSKLLLPNKYFGSTTPVLGFTKSLSTNV